MNWSASEAATKRCLRAPPRSIVPIAGERCFCCGVPAASSYSARCVSEADDAHRERPALPRSPGCAEHRACVCRLALQSPCGAKRELVAVGALLPRDRDVPALAADALG